MDAWKLGGNGYHTSHAAKWASASPDGVEFIGKLHLEFNRATVALSMFFLRHSVTLVVVCEKLGGWNISRWDLKQCMLIRLVNSIKFAHWDVLSFLMKEYLVFFAPMDFAYGLVERLKAACKILKQVYRPLDVARWLWLSISKQELYDNVDFYRLMTSNKL